jgi:hypothetical protein
MPALDASTHAFQPLGKARLPEPKQDMTTGNGSPFDPHA